MLKYCGNIWKFPRFSINFVVEITNKQTDIRKAVGQFAQPAIYSIANLRQFFFSAKEITNKITLSPKVTWQSSI